MMRNDEAAGGIVTLVFLVLLAGIMYVVTGYGIDRLTLMAGNLLTGTASQMRYDSFNLQLIIFRAEPVILLLGAGIHYWITEIRQYSSQINLGGMLAQAAEMIAVTFVLMIFTIFGGGALDYVVGITDAMAFNPGADQFTVIQYLSPTFYAFMVLLVVAVVANFVVKCFQITDYAQPYMG